MSVSIDEFERQLQWLKQEGYRSLSGAEFERALRGELDTERTVVLSFDDGYLDNWYLATPLLEKYGMNALLFVITGKIQERQQRSIGAWDEQDEACYLSWEEIDLMVASGVFEVHSHTHTHTRLWNGETSASETKISVCEDVAVSLQILRGRGYSHEIQLAWPWGYFRLDWLDEMAAMGITMCYTTRPGTNFPGCKTSLIRRLGGNSITSDGGRLFFAACSPLIGRGLNAASSAWGGIRGRP